MRVMTKLQQDICLRMQAEMMSAAMQNTKGEKEEDRFGLSISVMAGILVQFGRHTFASKEDLQRFIGELWDAHTEELLTGDA